MKIAGVDVGKHRLDVALHRPAGRPADDTRAADTRADDETAVDNAPAGIAALIAWLKAREVGRVGLEATGGYEKAVRLALEAASFEVVVRMPELGAMRHRPQEKRLEHGCSPAARGRM